MIDALLDAGPLFGEIGEAPSTGGRDRVVDALATVNQLAPGSQCPGLFECMECRVNDALANPDGLSRDQPDLADDFVTVQLVVGQQSQYQQLRDPCHEGGIRSAHSSAPCSKYLRTIPVTNRYFNIARPGDHCHPIPVTNKYVRVLMIATRTNHLTALPLALGVTAALLFLMQAMLRQGPVRAIPPDVELPMTFVQLVADPPPPPPTIIKPTPVVSPPVPTPVITVAGKPEPVQVQWASEPARPAPLTGLFDHGARDPAAPLDNAAPILLRAPPPAWPSGRVRDKSGYAVVSFDITAAGSADNIEVIAASHPEFGQSARRAASRLRYRPRLVDGEPILSAGHELRYRFETETETE